MRDKLFDPSYINKLLDNPNEMKSAANKIFAQLESVGEVPQIYRQLFCEMPASVKYHDCEKGGLVKHSFKVLKYVLTLANNFGVVIDWNMVYASFFHDAVKIGAYEEAKRWCKDENNKWIEVPYWKYVEDKMSFGHGHDSLAFILEYYPMLTVAWQFAVRYHMGAFMEGDKNDYAKAARKYPEVLLLHTADMIAVSEWEAI